jgi:hypothetical protein
MFSRQNESFGGVDRSTSLDVGSCRFWAIDTVWPLDWLVAYYTHLCPHLRLFPILYSIPETLLMPKASITSKCSWRLSKDGSTGGSHLDEQPQEKDIVQPTVVWVATCLESQCPFDSDTVRSIMLDLQWWLHQQCGRFCPDAFAPSLHELQFKLWASQVTRTSCTRKYFK